jgi:hypothetical protein
MRKRNKAIIKRYQKNYYQVIWTDAHDGLEYWKPYITTLDEATAFAKQIVGPKGSLTFQV